MTHLPEVRALRELRFGVLRTADQRPIAGGCNLFTGLERCLETLGVVELGLEPCCFHQVQKIIEDFLVRLGAARFLFATRTRSRAIGAPRRAAIFTCTAAAAVFTCTAAVAVFTCTAAVATRKAIAAARAAANTVAGQQPPADPRLAHQVWGRTRELLRVAPHSPPELRARVTVIAVFPIFVITRARARARVRGRAGAGAASVIATAIAGGVRRAPPLCDRGTAERLQLLLGPAPSRWRGSAIPVAPAAILRVAAVSAVLLFVVVVPGLVVIFVYDRRRHVVGSLVLVVARQIWSDRWGGSRAWEGTDRRRLKVVWYLRGKHLIRAGALLGNHLILHGELTGVAMPRGEFSLAVRVRLGYPGHRSLGDGKFVRCRGR